MSANEKQQKALARLTAPHHEPVPKDQFSVIEREVLHDIAVPYHDSFLTTEQLKQRYEPYENYIRKEAPAGARLLATMNVGISPYNTFEKILAHFSMEGDYLSMQLFLLDISYLQRGWDKLRLFGIDDFFSPLESPSLLEEEDYCILLGKTDQLLVENPSAETLQQSYLTSQESQKLCTYLRERYGVKIAKKLLENRLWDNSSNFSGVDLQHYRMGLHIIATRTYPKEINIAGFCQLPPQEQDQLALRLGKRGPEKGTQIYNDKITGFAVIENVPAKRDRDPEIERLIDKADTLAKQLEKMADKRKAPAPYRAPEPRGFNAGFSPLPHSPFSPSGLGQQHPLSPPAQPQEKKPAVLLEQMYKKGKLNTIDLQIISELKEYKEKLLKEIEEDKKAKNSESGFRFFRWLSFNGVPKEWKLDAVNKVLDHLKTHSSIENLQLTLNDRQALEQGRLGVMAMRIPGYLEAMTRAETISPDFPR